MSSTFAVLPGQRVMKHFASNRLLLTLAILVLCLASYPFLLEAQEQRPVFSSGVALVPITAVVRDARARLVRDLARNDFQVFENSQPRTIVDFKSSDDAPVTVAFLFDTSGSMPVAFNLAKGKDFVEHFLTLMEPKTDEAALFTFDKVLRQEVPFTNDRGRIHAALDRVRPWGLTSLYDAIAETAKRLGHRPSARRAVVVITDGDDTSSELSPAQVSALASAIDVPVYVVAVVSPLDHPNGPTSVRPHEANTGLTNLTYWTGGDLLYVTAAEQTGVVTRELLTTMRQQYFLAIESSTATGWHQLEVRTTRKDLTVRARGGYFSTPLRGEVGE